MRDLDQGQAPIVFRTNMDAGHGGKSGRFRRYRELSEMYAFMLDQLGVEDDPAQLLQFRAELIEQPGEAPRRGFVGRAHLSFASPRLHDQIDRTILQMQPPAIRQQCNLREPCHARGPGIGFCQGSWRISSPFCTSESGFT